MDQVGAVKNYDGHQTGTLAKFQWIDRRCKLIQKQCGIYFPEPKNPGDGSSVFKPTEYFLYRTVSYIAIDPKGTHSLMADIFFEEFVRPYPELAEKYDACLFAGIAFDLCSGADIQDVADAASVEFDTVWLFRDWLDRKSVV